mgnify:CR=1 FL=1
MAAVSGPVMVMVLPDREALKPFRVILLTRLSPSVLVEVLLDEAPDISSTPLTVMLLTDVLLHPEQLRTMVVVMVDARRRLVNRVLTGFVPSCAVVEPTALLHSL